MSHVKNFQERPDTTGDNTQVFDGTVEVNGTMTVGGIATFPGVIETTNNNLKRIVFSHKISFADPGVNELLIFPFSGTLIEIGGVLNVAQGGAETAIVNFDNGLGGDPITDTTITFPFLSIIGQGSGGQASANNVFAVNDKLSMVKSGSAATGTTITLIIVFELD